MKKFLGTNLGTKINSQLLKLIDSFYGKNYPNLLKTNNLFLYNASYCDVLVASFVRLRFRQRT